MSLYHELKRRNVFRVSAAYVVVAWLLIQVAETIFPLYGYGDAPARMAVTVLAIGFIPALIFAWVFEWTPEGLKRDHEVDREQSITVRTGKKLDRLIMVVLALALGYFAVDKFVLDPQRDIFITKSATQAGVEQARQQARLDMFSEKSIAVLPFTNRSNLQEDEFFTDGMHDELLTRLARISALKVISRTSVLRFRDTELSIPEIAKLLSVATILEGGVQRSGSQVRINVQLIDAQTDEHLWAEIYDRELTAENLFAIQSEISTTIADALNATLSPEEHARVTDLPTLSLEANYHYMRGRQLMINRDTNELLQSVREFEAAVEIDPEFALAWVGIADATLLLGDTGAIDFEEGRETRIRAAGKALALNDQLGEVYVAYGDTLAMKHMHEEATAAFVKAIELAPNYALAYHRYAMNLSGMESQEQRLALWQKATQLDPMTPVYQHNLAGVLTILGRDEEAMQQYMRLLELSPEFLGSYRGIAEIHFSKGHIAEAIGWNKQAVQLDPVNAIGLRSLANLYLSLEAYEDVARVRQWMAERLNPGDWRLPVLDYLVLQRQQNLQWALDYLEALPALWTKYPWIHGQKGYLHYLMGDLQKAREFWSKQENWPKGGEGNCYNAHVLMATGDEGLGRELLDQALHYFEVTLPGLTRHTDRDEKQGICYLLDGKPDKALDFFEQRIDHGHFTDWWEIRLVNLWGPMRNDPRFSALDQKVETLIAEQRELLHEMNKAEGDI